MCVCVCVCVIVPPPWINFSRRPPATYSLIRTDGVDLSAEHDAREEREEESLKHSKESEDERQRSRHHRITVLEVLSDTAKEEPRHHSETKHGHWHDVELQQNSTYVLGGLL